MNNIEPGIFYENRIETLGTKLLLLKRKKLIHAWLRFISFLIVLLVTWLLWSSGFWIAVGPVIFFLAVFVWIVKKDIINKEEIENGEKLLQINKNEIGYLQHKFTSFADGKELQPLNHAYANDLDIFGRASLYQYINRTNSEQGNKLLADWLLAPSSIEIILQRQAAMLELSNEKEWRQQLQAFGMAKPLQNKTQRNVLDWLKEKNIFLHHPLWKIVRFALPILSFSILALYLTGKITDNHFYSLLLILLAINLFISKKIMSAWLRLGKIAEELDTLCNSLKWIEQKKFDTNMLQQLKQACTSTSKVSASQSISRLKKILDRFDYRLNPVVFIPLSIFLCWDLQQIFALEKWKKENQDQLTDWFSSLAEFEVLSSIGNLSFNHPQWCVPKIVKDSTVFMGKEVGHPLIASNKRISNSFNTTNTAAINLITGSNMAGKSTFLRSVGVNIVLAMMGAPVCATELQVSAFKTISSMRISDNLEESTSTFYAELKKLKDVIDAVDRKENAFLLLDEILRGTNSADRHAGSKALIKQLVDRNAAGIIATHDLELAKLQQEHPNKIHNYHFDVQVAGEELFFDYKLKEGICQSMNASILMKKIGIEIS